MASDWVDKCAAEIRASSPGHVNPVEVADIIRRHAAAAEVAAVPAGESYTVENLANGKKPGEGFKVSGPAGVVVYGADEKGTAHEVCYQMNRAHAATVAERLRYWRAALPFIAAIGRRSVGIATADNAGYLIGLGEITVGEAAAFLSAFKGTPPMEEKPGRGRGPAKLKG